MQNQSEICEKIGIQISLIPKMEYACGLLKTTWEELAQNYTEFLRSMKSLSISVE